MKKLSLNETVSLLREGDNFLIITHKRPDGDTLGSGAALCSLLRRLGKRASLLRNPEVTPRYAPFLEPYATPEGFVPTDETLIAVDAASLGLFPAGFPRRAALCIDHHPSNEGYADALLLEAERAACGEIILAIGEALHGGLTREEADLLYIALSTDTGCFRFGNTDAHAFASASKLAAYGAAVGALNRLFFRTFSKARIAIEAQVTGGFRYFAGGKLTVAVVTREMVAATGATQDDMEDLAALPGQVEGTLVSVLAKENDRGGTKFSLRSSGTVDVSAICALYGGGGHKAAAGCELNLPPEAALAELVPIIEARLA